MTGKVLVIIFYFKSYVKFATKLLNNVIILYQSLDSALQYDRCIF